MSDSERSKYVWSFLFTLSLLGFSSVVYLSVDDGVQSNSKKVTSLDVSKMPTTLTQSIISPRRDEEDYSIATLSRTFHPTASSVATPTAAPTEEGEGAELRFTLARVGYDPIDYFVDKDTIMEYKFLSEHTSAIEPHSETKLVILSGDDDGFDDSDNYYRYRICKSDTVENCYEGYLYGSNSGKENVNPEIACDPFETFDVTLKKYSAENVGLLETKGTAICIYIRRELRSLTDADRNKTLDAMYEIWTLAEEEGEDFSCI
jgi:hypothetical protein